MIVKLVFDILNTENRSFEYKGDLSNEEYARRLQDYVNTTGRDVENMLYYGVTNTNNKSLYESTKDIQLETIDKECDALLLDINNNVIDETNLIEHVNDGKMFIIKINIDPNTLDMDGESEIKFWLDDSCRVLNDNLLPDDVKLKRLPQRNLRIKVKIDDNTQDTDEKNIRYNTYYLEDCRIIQNNFSEKYKYFFTLIIKKINF